MRRNLPIRLIAAWGALSLSLGLAGLAAPGIAHAAAPPLKWGPCEEDAPDLPARLVCGTLSVPVDWSKPKGQKFDLALAKLPAAVPDQRIGALLVNPGGPGGSGVGMVYDAESTFSPELINRFDIVSFDPRGQARSNPVRCDSDAALAQDALLFPAKVSEFARLRKTNRELGESCQELTGRLANHVDTADVVRDMDAVRSALGESKISYYGVSYGTMIGQQYAELFPARIRALAIDSNMDHAQDIWNYQKWEALAIEGSFLQFAAWCNRTAECALHDEDVPAYFDALYARAAAGELVVVDPDSDEPWVVTEQDLIWQTFSSMYNPRGWFSYADFLQQFSTDAPGRGEPVELGYRPVMCQDFHFDVRPYAAVAAMEQSLSRLAPHTRLNPLAWTDLTGCQNWPGPVNNPPHRLKASPALPPILMTNSRYDVATPYEWGTSLAGQLPSATFLTYDGVGHGDYWLSPCARAAIDTYLLTLQTPPKGTHCPAVFPTEQEGLRSETLVNPLLGSMSR